MDEIKNLNTQGNDFIFDETPQRDTHYHSLFKNNYSVMLLTDPETSKIVDANKAACSYYGYSHQEITKLLIGAINTLPRDQLIAEMHRALKEERNYFNFRHRLSNGEVRQVEVYSGPIFHMGKELLYSIVHDVTEKKLAEEELIRWNGRLAEMVEERTGELREANSILEETNAQLEEEIAERIMVQDKLAELNATLETLVFERTNQLQEINAELEETNAMLEEEISERMRIEEQLKKSEELYRSVYENSPLAFAIWDREFRFVDWNKRAEEIFGWTKEEVVGKPFVDFFVPVEIKENINNVLQGLLYHGMYRINANENMTREGKVLFCEWHNSLLHDGEGNLIGALSLGMDKTDSLKDEKDLKEAKEQAEAVNAELNRINSALKNEISERMKIEDGLRMAKFEAEQANIAKSQFLANMSHEIRTPMNGIIGMTDLALMTNLNDEQREYLTTVKTSTHLLLRVLNDILDYSKIEAGKIDLENDPFDIRKTTNEVIDLFMVAAKQKNMYIKLNIDGRIPQNLIGDSVRLRQVLSNLVGNGVKFTFDGGISIDIDYIRQYEGKIQIKFTIADTGIGISEENLSRLFKRFSQVDNSNTRRFGGTGLGLAIAKKLVEMMEGEIGVESKVAEGSKFYFTATFRLLEKDIEILSRDEVSIEDFQKKNTDVKKVLLVEDDEISRNLAVALLKKKGFRVTTAENGKEAIDIFNIEKFDLILMDINMPQMDGYSATAEIRAMEAEVIRRTPIVAMTAYALSGDREKCIKAGMDDYISKPIDFAELFRVVEKWIES